MGLEVGPFTFSKKEKPEVKNILALNEAIRRHLEELTQFTRVDQITPSTRVTIDQAISDIKNCLKKVEASTEKL